MNRKSFLRNSSLAALALAASAPANAIEQNAPAIDAGKTKPLTVPKNTPLHFAGPKVRLAILGTGVRGQSHLSLLLRRDDVDVVAICDIDDYMLSRAKAAVTKSGKKQPQVYTGSPYAWQDLLNFRSRNRGRRAGGLGAGNDHRVALRTIRAGISRRRCVDGGCNVHGIRRVGCRRRHPGDDKGEKRNSGASHFYPDLLQCKIDGP